MNMEGYSQKSIGTVVLAVVGVVLGAIALIAALKGQRDLGQRVATSEEELGRVVGRISQLEQQAANSARYEQQLKGVLLETAKTDNRVSNLEQQTRAGFSAVDQQMQTLTSAMSNSVARSSSGGGKKGKTSEPVREGEYKIKSGDTLAKIAKAHNTTVDALLKANPGLDDRKLRVDKKINIR